MFFEAKVNLPPCGFSAADCDQRSVSGFLSHLDSLHWHTDSYREAEWFLTG